MLAEMTTTVVRRPHGTRFNEAASRCSRKSRRASTHTAVESASMRPRADARGNSAASAAAGYCAGFNEAASRCSRKQLHEKLFYYQRPCRCFASGASKFPSYHQSAFTNTS